MSTIIITQKAAINSHTSSRAVSRFVLLRGAQAVLRSRRIHPSITAARVELEGDFLAGRADGEFGIVSASSDVV